MKGFTKLTFALLLSLSAATTTPPAPNSNLEFNVRDYGALGNGINDDTAAVQAAIDAASKAALSAVVVDAFGHPDAIFARGVVVFPRGHYNITQTLVLPSDEHDQPPPDLRGDGGRPLIQMSSANKSADLFFGSMVWRFRVSGLAFMGGRSHLHIGNNNTDKGQIVIEDCAFYTASGAAIRMIEPSRDLQPANVGMAPENRGAPHHTLAMFGGSFSTHLIIRDCVFDGNNQVLVNWCDWTKLSDSWVTTSAMMTNSTAVFENHDRLFLSNILAVPRETLGGGTQQRWVDNYAYRYDGGRVSLHQFRFGGEGNGLGGIYNFAPFACQLMQSLFSHMMTCGRVNQSVPTIPANVSIVPGSAITITESLVDTHQAIIMAIELPAHITVKENELRDGRGEGITVLNTSALKLDAPLFAELFARATGTDEAGASNRQWLSYDVASPSNWNGPTQHGAQLPEELFPYTFDQRPSAKAVPTRGCWKAGSLVYAAIPTIESFGWLCETSGCPGNWSRFGMART